MKKVVSLFLSMLMVLSLFSCLGVTTFAFDGEAELESISFEPAEAFEIYEYTGGFWINSYDDETEEIISEYYYDDAFDLWAEGNVITLGYSDGTFEEYISDGLWFYKEEGEVLDEDPLSYYFEDELGIGTSNMILEYDELTCEIPVTILETPVESVEFVAEEPVTLIEGISGSYYEPEDGPYSGEDVFCYAGGDLFVPGNKFVVTFKDGTEKIFECIDDAFYTDDGECFDWYYLDINDTQEYEPWLGTGDFAYNAYYMGCPFRLGVTVIENPVADVEYIPLDDYSLIANFDGDYLYCDCLECEDNEGEFFYYEIVNSGFPYDGDIVRVTYKDDTIVDYMYSLEDDWFYDAEGNELPYGVDIKDYQDEDHWTVGTNYVYFEYAGYEAVIPVEVVENPVVGIDVDFGSNATIYEFTKGDYEYDEYTEEDYFEYENPLWYDGSKLTVQFADGSEKTYVYNSVAEWLVSEDTGAYFPTAIETSDNQFDEHWGIGQHNVTVTALGFDCELTVKVIVNPIGSIEFIPAEPITFQAFEDGWWDIYYDDYGEEVEYYYYDTSELTPYSEGNKIIVTYTNGNKGTFVYDEEIGSFVNAKGQPMTKAMDINYLDTQCYEPWSEESAYNYMVVEFFGRYDYVWVNIENGLPEAPVMTQVYNGVGKICVEWEYTPGATEYRVYRRGAGQKYWTYIGTTADNYFEDNFTMGTEKLKDFQYYRYTVRGVNSHGFGSYDEGIYTRYLPPVKNVKATNIVGGVQISWDDYKYPSNIECVVLRIAAGESEWEILGVAPGSGFAVNDYYVENGKYYRYAVVAGYGDYLSDFDTSLTSLIKCVETPELTGVSNATGGIHIKWNAIDGATAYRVYRRGAGTNVWTYLGTTTNLYYTDTAVKNSNGNYYRYTVRAVSYSTFSGFDTDGLYIKRLANPTLTSAKSSKEGITVKWNAVQGTTGYYVYRKTANSGWVCLGSTGGTNNTTYVDKTAVKGVTYTYTVRACYGKTVSYFNSGITCKDLY